MGRMPKKEALLDRLKSKPTDFTTRELDTLMAKCGCKKFSGGRGSSFGYKHLKTGRIIQFDMPHPRNELYRYQVRDVISFLKEVGEM